MTDPSPPNLKEVLQELELRFGSCFDDSNRCYDSADVSEWCDCCLFEKFKGEAAVLVPAPQPKDTQILQALIQAELHRFGDQAPAGRARQFKDLIYTRAEVEQLLASVLVPAPPEPQEGKHARTRYGGSCGTTPFYLFDGQCEPEYDQGHSVIVWYDDIHDLSVRAAAARSPTPAAQAWQPIETAPKDGTRILLVSARHQSILIGYWKEPAEFDRFQSKPGWQIFECEDSFYSWAEENPTHWQPLPSPPVGSPAPAKEP